MKNLCSQSWYNVNDEETDETFCDLMLDEDEYVKFLIDSSQNKTCKYFRADGGEYEIVRKQN